MSVYTELSRAEIERILADYDLGRLVGFQGIADGIENTNYFVDTEHGRFVLTIFERMDAAELPYFLRLMHHLSGHGIPCPDVMRRRDGSLLFSHRGKRGAIISRLPGTTLPRLNARQLAASGAAQAALHLAGADFRERRPNPTGLDWMHAQLAAMRERIAGRYGQEALSMLDEELAWQAAHPCGELPAGVIHGDLFVDNILFEGDAVSGIIDFYYAHDAPYALDLAIALNAQAVELGEEDPARIRAYLEGYESVRRLTEAERNALPALLRLAALRFWISRLRDALFPRDGAMTQIKDPEEYRRKLGAHRQGLGQSAVQEASSAFTRRTNPAGSSGSAPSASSA